MKKFLIVAVFALSLSGCAWWEGNKGTVQQVVDFAISLCSFSPKVEAVAAMLAAPNPTVTGAFQIALAICTAVSPLQGQGLVYQPKTGFGDGECPKINDVCVEGEFVEPKPDPVPEPEKKDGE